MSNLTRLRVQSRRRRGRWPGLVHWLLEQLFCAFLEACLIGWW